MKRIILSLSAILILNFELFTLPSFAQVAIAGGEYHSMFVCSSGVAKSCGNNVYGMLGDGTSGTNRINPVFVSSAPDVKAVSAGDFHSLFVKSDGTVYACGDNTYGQLGDGTTNPHSAPTLIPTLSGIIAAAAGQGFSLFLKNDSTVWACGRNANGELGDSTYVDKHTPIKITRITGVKAIAAGFYHSLFLKGTGTVYSCGQNYRGQLGTGNNMDHIIPTVVSSLTNVKAISAGWEHSLFLKNDGTAWACGYNYYGQLGDNTYANRATRVQVATLTGIIAISAGGNHSLFVKSDGTAWSCGWNNLGELGCGTAVDSTSSVVQVSGLTGITNVAGGGTHSLFAKNDTTVWACGSNSSGQLGDSTTTNRLTPVLVKHLCVNPTLEVDEYNSQNVRKLVLQNQPFTNELKATFYSPENSKITFRIYDIHGQIMKSETIDARAGENPLKVDLKNFSSGIYFIRLYNDAVNVQQKFVKM